MIQRAIVRKPGANFAGGLTSGHLGTPDLDLALEQHRAYRRALERRGIVLTVLEADPDHPDGPFVEDTALVVRETAVMLRPGADSRRGEVERIAAELAAHRPIRRIEPPGTVDGGDILRVGKRVFVGLSGRTNREGAGQLAGILSDFGYDVTFVPVNGGLHLKSAVTAAGPGVLVMDAGFKHREPFEEFDIIETSPEEAHAANVLAVNGDLLMAARAPKLQSKLEERGFQLEELEMSEFNKMDGALTCLSLLF